MIEEHKTSLAAPRKRPVDSSDRGAHRLTTVPATRLPGDRASHQAQSTNRLISKRTHRGRPVEGKRESGPSPAGA